MIRVIVDDAFNDWKAGYQDRRSVAGDWPTFEQYLRDLTLDTLLRAVAKAAWLVDETALYPHQA